MPTRAPKLLILAGPNGSGKTTFCELLQQHEWGIGCTTINADAIANALGDWNDATHVATAQQMAKAQLDAALAAGKDVIYETVFSHPSKLEMIRKAIQSGYFVRLFFICTESPRINIDRVAERFAKGGHSVPGRKVSERYSRALLYGAEAMRLVHRGYLYDNSCHATESSHAFRLIFRTMDGGQYKLYMPQEELSPSYSYFLQDFCRAVSSDENEQW